MQMGPFQLGTKKAPALPRPIRVSVRLTVSTLKIMLRLYG